MLASGQRLECLAVVGADGARSAVAAAAGRGPPNYCGQSAIRCVRLGRSLSCLAVCLAAPPLQLLLLLARRHAVQMHRYHAEALLTRSWLP
jgi:2-polyprenyl-6-methoxyphenol hydroxylase-like FAD-dependent oxidoreductase